jgi:hypothetical protein
MIGRSIARVVCFESPQPNYRMQLTVRPVTSVAEQRPRLAVPQLTHRR